MPSALTSVNADWALPCSSLPGDHDCPYVPVADRSLSHADRTPRLGAPGSRRLRPDLAVLLSAPIRGVGYGPCAPPLPPIGLTAAGLFAGGQVSSADSRVRSPVTLTCARCPAVRSALDAGPEAYHNPAAVWWGAFAASAVIRGKAAGAGRVASGRAEPGRRRCEPRRVRPIRSQRARRGSGLLARCPARVSAVPAGQGEQRRRVPGDGPPVRRETRSGHWIQDGKPRVHDSNPDLAYLNCQLGNLCCMGCQVA